MSEGCLGFLKGSRSLMGKPQEFQGCFRGGARLVSMAINGNSEKFKSLRKSSGGLKISEKFEDFSVFRSLRGSRESYRSCRDFRRL